MIEIPIWLFVVVCVLLILPFILIGIAISVYSIAAIVDCIQVEEGGAKDNGSKESNQNNDE